VGRRSRSRALEVWANGQHVGRWLIPANGPMEFRYDPAWVESREARPLSLSLPINLDGEPIKGDEVGFYFDNLLPDSDAIRRRVATRYGTPSRDPFDLLAAVGRDCVGAVQLLPEGKEPEGVFEIQIEPLDELAIEQQILASTTPPSPAREADEDDFRISIAGAQEKTALTWHDGRWCKPRGSTPTTHIFKLPLGLVGNRQVDMSTSIENEWLCARILAEYGVPIAPCDIQRFGSTKTLVVTRFDRKLHSSGRYWLRLPQEDFCQATGTPGSRKYEADGGPGLDAIARVLRGSEARDEDLATLLRAELLFWMLAATDGHAKNFSLHLLPQGRYRLTPLYDVLSAWPVSGSGERQMHAKKLKLAMGVRDRNKHYRIAEIQRRHFNATAQQCGHGLDMEALIADIVARTPHVIEEVGRDLPESFPMQLFESMARKLREQAASMEAMPPR
jgi:serine/threonine-protein kinase HipA